MTTPPVEYESKTRFLRALDHFWVKNQPFLLSVGFKLRPRYDPDWVPTGENEDRMWGLNRDVLDAIRIHEGKKVVLKRVDTDSDELKIIQYLSQIDDSRNHTIPLLGIIPLPPDNASSLLVMPYTRQFDHPPFHCRAEFVELMRQYLEGLQFMHDNNVAHFDIAPQNLMMDESRVVPAGSHFRKPRSHTGIPGIFSWRNRCSVGPVEYYYIDFGLSKIVIDCAIQPIQSGRLPIGIDNATIDKALRAFRPVADSMTSRNPQDRPEPADSLAKLNIIAAKMSARKLKTPMLVKEGQLTYMAQTVISLFRNGYPPTERYEDLGYTTWVDRVFGIFGM
ncbi:kinase domain-containing protein [Favolaschia claudopus]|uniref:Kinase domain-containing protein n=1 Tax=Favolaschia claudopus TaxID=2862362 RepID=A0AAW0EDH9_9AGAR